MSDSPKHILLQLPFNKVVIISISIIYSFGLPFLAVYNLYPKFFETWDTLKLILFCSSVGLIIYSIHFLLIFCSVWLKNERIRMISADKALDDDKVYESTATTTIIYITICLLLFLSLVLLQNYTPNVLIYVRSVLVSNLFVFISTIFYRVFELNRTTNKVRAASKERILNTNNELNELNLKIIDTENRLSELSKHNDFSDDDKEDMNNLKADLEKLRIAYNKLKNIFDQAISQK